MLAEKHENYIGDFTDKCEIFDEAITWCDEIWCYDMNEFAMKDDGTVAAMDVDTDATMDFAFA